MALISTKLHGILDYTVGMLLVVSTYVLELGTGGPQTWLPLILGFSTLTYSLLTNYEAGPVKLLPMKAHLLLDTISGVLLITGPWIFHFTDKIFWPHILTGCLEIIIVVLSSTHPYRRSRKHIPLDRQHKVHPDLY